MAVYSELQIEFYIRIEIHAAISQSNDVQEKSTNRY